MKHFGWRIAEALAIVLMALFVLVPSFIEDEFIGKLYTNNPIFCDALLAASIGFIAVTFTHKVVENRRNKKASSARLESDKTIV